LQTQLLLAKSQEFVDENIAEQIENKIEEFQKATMSFQNTLN
jgi:hypothetical protein